MLLASIDSSGRSSGGARFGAGAARRLRRARLDGWGVWAVVGQAYRRAQLLRDVLRELAYTMPLDNAAVRRHYIYIGMCARVVAKLRLDSKPSDRHHAACVGSHRVPMPLFRLVDGVGYRGEKNPTPHRLKTVGRPANQ